MNITSREFHAPTYSFINCKEPISEKSAFLFPSILSRSMCCESRIHEAHSGPEDSVDVTESYKVVLFSSMAMLFFSLAGSLNICLQLLQLQLQLEPRHLRNS